MTTAYLMDRVATSAEVRILTEQKIGEAEVELSIVNRELKKAAGEVPAALSDPEGAVDAILGHFRQLGRDLSSQLPESVRRVLGQLVEKLSIDPETFELHVTLRLPATMAWTAYEITGVKCPVPPHDPKWRNWTDAAGIALATARAVPTTP